MTTNGNGTTSPRPVPEFGTGSGDEVPAVTDDERNRFGTLLDAAAERGLLSPTDYQARLVEVAEATSVAELQRIVTELPAFGVHAGAGTPGPATASGSTTSRMTPGGAPSAPDLDAILWAGRTQAVARRTRGNHWWVLVLVVAVLLVALVALGLVAAHLSHTHGAGTSSAVVGGVSPLRL